MKQTIPILFILAFLVGQTYGRNDTGTDYENLKTKKFYSLGIFFQYDSGESKYKVSDKEANKKTIYRKYEKTWGNMETHYPCILKSFDEDNSLLREAVSCTYCGVGSFKEFFSNGQVKPSGRYNENPTGSWDDIWNRNYSSTPDGQRIYYDEKGIILCSEFWKEGSFIKQIPEHTTTKNGEIDLTLNGDNVGQKMLLTDQLKDLIVTPKFENTSTYSVNLTAEFQVSALGWKSLKQIFTLDSFKLFNPNKYLLENGYKTQDKIKYESIVLNDQSYIAKFDVNISANLSKSMDSIINPIYSSKTRINTSNFYLVNSSNSTKKIKLSPKIAYELDYIGDKLDTLVEQKTITLEGYIVNHTESSIDYKVLTESIYLKLKDGSNTWLENNYKNCNYSGNDNLRNISLKNLNYIKYTGPRRKLFETVGTVATALSVLTTFIIAPLISINYKNGSFNKDKYFTVSSRGLIGLYVGVPLILFSRPKAYKLTEKNTNQGKKYWYIQPQVRQ